MIYWSETQLPELLHLPPQERRFVWICFASARALIPTWFSDRIAAALILTATSAGFSFGLFAFSSLSFAIVLSCGVAGILVGFFPGVLLFLYIINSESVRRDLNRFANHPEVISNLLAAVLDFRSRSQANA